MRAVKAKKYLGQHFLTDKNIAEKIVNSLQLADHCEQIIEVGAGMGILSDYLLKKKIGQTYLIDIDQESIHYLREKYPDLSDHLLHADFLALNFQEKFIGPCGLIGNLPYHISSQILFKILEHRNQIVEVVVMLQKEVAQRCAEKPGTKEYGILSVLLQAYYQVEYLFTVKPGVFYPPPKVLSAVIRLTRNVTERLDCDEKLFWQIVKVSFNQRRKTLRNALSSFINKDHLVDEPIFALRAERLSVTDFIQLTNMISLLT